MVDVVVRRGRSRTRQRGRFGIHQSGKRVRTKVACHRACVLRSQDKRVNTSL
jgi:hypothetical protein